MERSQNLVVITGISGYLGSQVCKLFLEDGSFRVRGTVRDKTNEKKVAPLRKAFGALFEKLELVEADLTNAQSLENAIEGVDFVVHTASPFPDSSPKDENVLIRPAVDGTLAVVRAAHKNRVKRVVITSSVAAIMMQTEKTSKEQYTEEDWSNLEGIQPYEKSKTLAERAAWDFVNGLPDDEKFELVTINPSLILGPAIVQSDFTSGQVIRKLLNGDFPGVPRINFPLVDVRDVALAHLRAITVPEARNNRFILNCQGMWFKDIAETLKAEYGKYYKVKTGELKYCTIKFVALFDKQAKMILPFWNKALNLDNRKSREILGIQYQNTRDTIVGMADSMIDSGLIKDKRKK
eukprot:403368849